VGGEQIHYEPRDGLIRIGAVCLKETNKGKKKRLIGRIFFSGGDQLAVWRSDFANRLPGGAFEEGQIWEKKGGARKIEIRRETPSGGLRTKRGARFAMFGRRKLGSLRVSIPKGKETRRLVEYLDGVGGASRSR